MKIESVCIVGAGSSGWMSAALLSKVCPHLEIAIIEDARTKPIGVGESTLGHFNKFLDLLELEDEDWMPACNATYKNSIRFTNFREGKGEAFEYPFAGHFDQTFSPNGMNTWGQLALIDPENFGPESFAEYFTDNTFLAKYNRCTKDEEGKLRAFDFNYDTAYHLDADLFGKYLKEKIAIPNGVQVIQGHVTGYQPVSTSDSSLKYIILDKERAVFADLYIDCTGFRSQLLERFSGSQYMSYEKKLLNDKAWATRIPYEDKEKEMHNVTDCHAMKNGWVWNIPLWNRIGTGYCYSSKFCTKDEAEQEFREHLGERGKDAELFHIDIRHGKHLEAWKNNVVGIGLSYGFLEPLESTGLMTTHENIIHLAYMLNLRDGYTTQTDRDNYNYIVMHDIDNLSDFIAMHYAFSMRTDTPYWRKVTQNVHYHPASSTEWKLKHSSFTDWAMDTIGQHSIFANHNGIAYIAAGHGYKPTPYLQALKADFKRLNSAQQSTMRGTMNIGAEMHQYTIEGLDIVKKDWLTHREKMVEYVESLPTHYQFLKENIYKEES